MVRTTHDASCQVDNGVRISPESSIGRNIKIGKGSVFKGNCIIGDSCRFGCRVRAVSVKIGIGVRIGDDAVLKKGVRLGHWVVVGKGSVVGHGAQIGDGTKVMPGVRIPSGWHIPASCIINKHPLQWLGFPPVATVVTKR